MIDTPLQEQLDEARALLHAARRRLSRARTRLERTPSGCVSVHDTPSQAWRDAVDAERLAEDAVRNWEARLDALLSQLPDQRTEYDRGYDDGYAQGRKDGRMEATG